MYSSWLFFPYTLWAQAPRPPQHVGVVCTAHTTSQDLSLLFNGKRYSLNDDGKQPDHTAGDGTATVFIETQGEGNTDIALYDGPQVLWLGMVPLPPAGRQTWISFSQIDGQQKPVVKVKFQALATASEGSGSGSGLPWSSAWVILGIGLIGGYLFRRPTTIAFRPWKPQKSQDPQEEPLIKHLWGYHTLENALEALQELHHHYNLLLCTTSERLEHFSALAHLGRVHIYTHENFEPKTAQLQWKLFSQFTPCVVVLDGTHGWVLPQHHESAEAILQEFLDLPHIPIICLWSMTHPLQGITPTRIFDEHQPPQKDQPKHS